MAFLATALFLSFEVEAELVRLATAFVVFLIAFGICF